MKDEYEPRFRKRGMNRTTIAMFILAAVCYGLGLSHLSADTVPAVILILIGGIANCLGWLWTYEEVKGAKT